MKRWYASKTLWVNIISIVAILAQTYAGKEIISPELQVMVLGVINLVLRMITKESLQR